MPKQREGQKKTEAGAETEAARKARREWKEIEEERLLRGGAGWDREPQRVNNIQKRRAGRSEKERKLGTEKDRTGRLEDVQNCPTPTIDLRGMWGGDGELADDRRLKARLLEYWGKVKDILSYSKES